MLVVCPNCATSYDADIASLQTKGRRVCWCAAKAFGMPNCPKRRNFLPLPMPFPVRRAIEAVALTLAEESALAPQGEPPAGWVTEPIGEV